MDSRRTYNPASSNQGEPPYGEHNIKKIECSSVVCVSYDASYYYYYYYTEHLIKRSTKNTALGNAHPTERYKHKYINDIQKQTRHSGISAF